MKVVAKGAKKEVVVVLDNLRSVHNVGSIFRTSDAAGIGKIYLCGITPTPIDKYGRERSDFVKVSLGSEKTVKWETFSNTMECLKKLKEEGFYIVAIEQDKSAKDYKKINLKTKKKIAFLIGTETTGIEKKILSECDTIAEIKMFGKKESLNVTIAFGIAIYRMLGI